MKRILVGLVVLGLIAGLWWVGERTGGGLLSPSAEQVMLEKPYDKYGFARLAERGGQASQIEVGRQVGAGEGYESRMFYYHSEGRRISGQLNLPVGQDAEGVVLMARGYVDKEEYQTGVGTRNAAAVYAQNGYMTLAPDFSGYGESDLEDDNVLGARLVKPVEILDLLASLSTLPGAKTERVYLWGHSNGGQIMLSVAEVLGGDSSKYGVKGVTLWAPVSKPFPYNILYYTDEASDSGKWLRAVVAQFESDYDVFDYSIDRYLDRIKIPLLIHQGSADESVPKRWSDELVSALRDKDKVVTYHAYPGADHNMRPVWDTVVSRDLAWFR